MPQEIQKVSLSGLMTVLLGYGSNMPVWMYSVTIPKCNMYSRADKALPRDKQKKCPYLTFEEAQQDEKGGPGCLIRKHSKMMVRINDDYEQAVRRRFIAEQKQEGRTAPLDPDEEFVADKPTWGAKLPTDMAAPGEKEAPPLFEWWIPKYTTSVKFYMAVRPVQCQEVWYEYVAPHVKAGQRLTEDEVKDCKANYFTERDEEMEALRQNVDRPVTWRKFLFSSIMAMTVDGIRYDVYSHEMPEVPAAHRERLLALLDVRTKEKQEIDAKALAKKQKAAKKIPAGVRQGFPEDGTVVVQPASK